MNTSEKGNKFEKEIANIYECLGYNTTRNAYILGQQVDIIAERSFPGIGKTKLLVECKFKTDNAVSNQEVFDFCNMFNAVKAKKKFTKGIFITNYKYSKDCFEINEENGDIELLTYDELESQLFDLRTSFLSFKINYENNEIFTKYIFQEATTIDMNPLTKFTNIFDTLISYIKDSNYILFNILGDYGMGKTTLLEKIKYSFVDSYLKDSENSLKPLLIQLKNFHLNNNSIDNLLKFSIQKEYEREIPLDIFWEMAKKGKFIFLLDGFDEMAPQVNKEKRIENFILLSKFFSSGSKTIITCRPSYFITNSEFNEVVTQVNDEDKELDGHFKETKSKINKRNLNVFNTLKKTLHNKFINNVPIEKIHSPSVLNIAINRFDDKQIDKYLQNYNDEYLKKYNLDYKKIKEKLSKIYDLNDLMKQPILLEMINQTILAGNLFKYTDEGQLSHSNLYDVYVNLKLDVDWDKGESRKFLTKELRLQFSQAIALAMLKKSDLQVSYSEIIEIVKENDNLLNDLKVKLSEITIDEIVTDIQICAFLIREQDGIFRFGHKSIMEFLVGLYLKQLIEQNIQSTILERNLSKEILYFLGGFGITEPKIKNRLIELLKNTESNSIYYRNNLIAAIIHSDYEYKNLHLNDGEIVEIKNKKTNILGGSFKNLKITQTVDIFCLTNFRTKKFEHKCVANDTILLDDVNNQSSSFEYDVQQLKVVNTSFEDSDFKVESKNFQFVNVTFIDSRLYLNLKSNSGVYGKICNCKFHSTKFIFNSKLSISFRDFDSNIFESSLINGMVLYDKQYLSSKFTDCQGFILIKEPFSGIGFGLDDYLRYGDFFLIKESALKKKETIDYLYKIFDSRIDDTIAKKLIELSK